jgi:hypothetical protein
MAAWLLPHSYFIYMLCLNRLNTACFDHTRPSFSVVHVIRRKLFCCSILRSSETPIKINLIICRRYRQRNYIVYPHVTIALYRSSSKKGKLGVVIHYNLNIIIIIIYTSTRIGPSGPELVELLAPPLQWRPHSFLTSEW